MKLISAIQRIFKNISQNQEKSNQRKKTGTCAKHQREVSTAIKRARIMGLLPFVEK